MKRRISLLLALFTLALVPAALAAFSDSDAAAGSSISAGFVLQGNTPDVNATGSDVTVSWEASELSGGQVADGYEVRRYESSTDALQTIGTACAGTIAPTDPDDADEILSCVETAVPPGSWEYRIVPHYANWTGPESGSGAVTVAVAPSVMNGPLWSWGANGSHQLGRSPIAMSSPSDQPGPIVIPTPMPTPFEAADIAAGQNHALAAKADGTVWAWGDDTQGATGQGDTTGDTSLPAQVAGLTDVVDVAAGTNHSLAVKSDGTVWAWGAQGAGRLGNGATSGSSSTPVQVTAGMTGLPDPTLNDGNKITAVAGGDAHSLAVTKDGRVYAWGSQGAGRLGNGVASGTAQPTAVQVTTGMTGLPDPAISGNKIVAVAAGNAHSLALTEDGRVYAWGDNGLGRNGNGMTAGNQTVPGQVLIRATDADTDAGLPDPTLNDDNKIVAIAAGDNYSLAVTADGRVYAWGANGNGQLGVGDTTNRSLATRVAFPSGAAAIVGLSAGNIHTLAVDSSGVVFAWGSNGNGRLGLGSGGQQNAPVAIAGSGFTTIEQVIAGGNFSLARQSP